MKVLYVSQFYEPENIAPAFRAAEHSRIWANSGTEVTVFTGWPNYPIGKVFEGYEVEMLAEENADGVRILRSKLIAKPNTSLVGRIQNGLSFLWYGLLNIQKNSDVIGADYDVVFTTSGTIFAGYLGYKIARKLKKPFVIEYRDITYVQIMATGSSGGSLKCKGVKWLELMMAKKADKIIVLTNSFKEALSSNGINEGKIEVIPNGANIVDIERASGDTFTLGYFGTMGLSQALPETVIALRPLNDQLAGIRYILVGEGAARSDIESCLNSPENSFVELNHGMSKDELEKYYAKLDMSVVSLRRSDAFKGTIPSKIFQSWARGIPVLFFGPDGEAAGMIRSFGLGIVLCGSDDQNRETLLNFFQSPSFRDDLKDMGIRAKALVAERYTRERLGMRALRVLEEVSINTEGTIGD